MSDHEPTFIEDGRALPIFIHSDVDELPLTPNAFRIYGHLARRAGRDGDAHPGYDSMAEKCLRPMYRKAKASTLRQRARDAVRELEAFGLILRIERKGANGITLSNGYQLTERTRWNWPAINQAAVEIWGGAGDQETACEGGGDQRPLGDQRPVGDQRPETNVREGTNVPKDTPIKDNSPKLPDLNNSQQTGGSGGSQPSGESCGESSTAKTKTAGGSTAVAEEVSSAWIGTFGSMTPEQERMLQKKTKDEWGTRVTLATIAAIADNIRAGQTIHAPGAYFTKVYNSMDRELMREQAAPAGGSSPASRSRYVPDYEAIYR